MSDFVPLIALPSPPPPEPEATALLLQITPRPALRSVVALLGALLTKQHVQAVTAEEENPAALVLRVATLQPERLPLDLLGMAEPRVASLIPEEGFLRASLAPPPPTAGEQDTAEADTYDPEYLERLAVSAEGFGASLGETIGVLRSALAALSASVPDLTPAHDEPPADGDIEAATLPATAAAHSRSEEPVSSPGRDAGGGEPTTSPAAADDRPVGERVPATADDPSRASPPTPAEEPDIGAAALAMAAPRQGGPAAALLDRPHESAGEPGSGGGTAAHPGPLGPVNGNGTRPADGPGAVATSETVSPPPGRGAAAPSPPTSGIAEEDGAARANGAPAAALPPDERPPAAGQERPKTADGKPPARRGGTTLMIGGLLIAAAAATAIVAVLLTGMGKDSNGDPAPTPPAAATVARTATVSGAATATPPPATAVAMPSAPADWPRHAARAGESIEAIARFFGATVDDLLKVNGLPPGTTTVPTDRVLIIPRW